MSYKSIYFPTLQRRSTYVVRSHYKHYRQDIRIDCLGRCVYCDAHENELGGEECMTLDHFKPQNHFRSLQNDPTNLVWACIKCNGFKQNYWPAIGTSNIVSRGMGFIDPFLENRFEYFDILQDGSFKALKAPADYLIRTLKLNRTGAKKVRENRNKKYERMRRAEEFYARAIQDIEILLRKTTKNEERADIFQYKEKLEKDFEPILCNGPMNL